MRNLKFVSRIIRARYTLTEIFRPAELARKNAYTLAEVFRPAEQARKFGYTLAEVVIVMLIIAVIAAISIKISKTKLDSMVSLTYYSAFQTLRSVSEEMLKDYRNINDYTAGTDNGDKVTMPRSADKYCEFFEGYVNNIVKEGEDVCNGDSATESSDFNAITPDLRLRNGMKLYNVSQEAGVINDLANNTEGEKYTKDGTEIDTNKWGYTIYVDLNGAKGNGELWDDVYKFYITMSGKVIPAYNPLDGDGGNSRFHLQTSVKEESDDSWVKKSVSYKEAACTSGYIGDATPYCKNAPAVTKAAKCTGTAEAPADCTLRFIMPVRF